jgi:hypothetical protein
MQLGLSFVFARTPATEHAPVVAAGRDDPPPLATPSVVGGPTMCVRRRTVDPITPVVVTAMSHAPGKVVLVTVNCVCCPSPVADEPSAATVTF